MDRDRWQKIEKIIDQALERESPKEQIKFVNQYSYEDQQLHQELLVFLRSIHKAQEENFLQK